MAFNLFNMGVVTMISDSDSIIGLAIQYAPKKKPLLELCGGGAPAGQTRFTK